MIRYVPARLMSCLFLLLFLLNGYGCGLRGTVHHASVKENSRSGLPFEEIADRAHVRFRHVNGGASPLNILQTAGAGCAFLDYDQDGWLDIFLVNGCSTETPIASRPPRHALYHNNHDGTFTDVSATAGFTDQLYGMGCVAADYDGDGYPDLLVTGYEGVALYHNNHDGTWSEVTAQAGLRESGWRTGAAFADVDGDGWLDLYICGYVKFGVKSRQLCDVRGIPVACSPRYYDGDAGHLYRNNGNGTFTDVTVAAGVKVPLGSSFGCLFFDYDEDGKTDLYVANDGVGNCMFHNLGRSRGVVRFKDEALLLGAAFDGAGKAQASMGLDAADFDGDGHLDLFITNFQNESDGLYRNQAGSGFAYVSREAGLDVTLTSLSFGCGFLDYDNDGWPDLFTVSGHVQDRIHEVDSQCTFAQPRHLLHNRHGTRFEEAVSGTALSVPAVGRGVALGDFDNDGGTDILVNNNGGPAMLLRNTVGSRTNWLRVRLRGRYPNRFAIGARVTVVAGGRSRVQEIFAGNGYASSGDPRPLFGLGRDKPVSVRVRWPDGSISEVSSPPCNQELVVDQH